MTFTEFTLTTEFYIWLGGALVTLIAFYISDQRSQGPKMGFVLSLILSVVLGFVTGPAILIVVLFLGLSSLWEKKL